ncbi:PQQ-binding-like beta-propeller repeat protein [Prosthecobacter sp.]|uniref:outer membrane protein assembly factor BamB family protein n=1 Tax=Prosthecobacter sp. TaxID=1965333 RepID=UPI001D34FB08|nr:PQQ-binding-like beta-propeller repeat protein [Prosthecobacter sp.]MCB1278052.1 PQQ-binding-like beta-propeller repeat protein [Prosthecobacter sp.]
MKAAILPVLLVSITLQAEDWAQFRGANGSGVSSSKGLPQEFSADKNISWKAKIGDGIGSPIIKNGRVFTTAMLGDQKLGVFSFDAASGKQLWQSDFDTGTLPRITPPNSHASSTPATDGERVYVYFSTIGLLAFDFETGKEVWRHTLPRPAYLMDWGAASSPIVYNGMVIFCQDDDLAPFLVAVDAKTGKEKWRTPRKDMLAGYALPVLCEANGRTDLVIAGSGKLKGYDPATGKELWTCNTLLRTIMTSPVVHDGVIYIAVQSYGDSTRTLKYALLEWLDTNQDKVLSREETPKEFHERFDASDKNKNGLIDPDEIDTAFQSPDNMAVGGNIIQAIKGGGSGDVTKTHVLWNLDHKTPSNIASPLLFNDRLYLVKGGGMSSCYDAKDGKTLWDRSRLGNFGDYFASPVAADGKVFIAGKNGFVVVLEDGPEMKVLGKNDIGEEIIATPSIADGRLFIRTRESLVCVSASASTPTLAEVGKAAVMPADVVEITAQPAHGSRVWNGYTGNAMGQESWSTEELEQLLKRLQKLKYTTIAIPAKIAPFTPIRVDGDTGGRKAFHGASTFGNADVTAITARFREHAGKLGFEIIATEPVAGSVLPKNDFASEKALSDFVTPMCGEGVAERMWLGFQAIDKASQLIAQNDPELGIPAPDMLLRHLNSKKSLPDWLTEAKTFYATAMNEMYRANTRAREGSRSFTLYNAKRLEFTFHFMSAIEALYKAHDPAARAESLEAAMDSIYNALNSWSDVARDSSDRGGIALLNEYGYRPLVKVIKGGR